MPRRRPRNRCRLVALLVLAAGCASEAREPGTDPGSQGVRVVDGLGREVILEGPAERIVSLVPSATLTLDALDARSALVGRTDFDTVSWSADLPSVGGGLQPSIEAVVSLDPDAVILFGGEQDPVTPARLDELGIPWVGIRPDGIADVLVIIGMLGTLTGREVRAAALVDSLQAELAAVAAGAPGGPAPRVAYVMGGTPPWVAGPGTYIHELIELAGGENVFADLGSLYSSVSPEELVSRGVDVVLVSDAGAFDARLTPDARVVEVGGSLQLPGPGVADAAREVAAALRRPGG